MRAPPKRPPAPNASGRQGGEGEGGPPTQQRTPAARSGGTGGTPEHTTSGPPREIGSRRRKGPPCPSRGQKLRAGKNVRGTDRARPRSAGSASTRGGPPCTAACAPSAWHARSGGGEPPKQSRRGKGGGRRLPTSRNLSSEEGGDPPARQCALPAHGMTGQEKGSPLKQEDEEAPEERALPAHGMQGQGETIIALTH